MTTESAPRAYSLVDLGLITDPCRGFGRIREEAPVVRGRLGDGSTVWIATRHQDVSAILADPRFVNNTRSLPGTGTDFHAESLLEVGVAEDVVPYLAGNMVHTDPPDHTRLRKLVSRAFSAKRIAALRPRVEAVTRELLDTLPDHAENGTVDLLAHFGYPLPLTVIFEMLDVPAEDRPKWRTWVQDANFLDAQALSATLADNADYLSELCDRRRAEPGDDLLSELVRAHLEGSDRLSRTELITMVLTLITAGHETTAHLIGNGTTALLTHPGQLALLRADPALVPGAVQELLRWCGPVVLAKLRYATEDMVIADVPIRRGDRVQLVLTSANHDPRRFPDPEVLDITRTPGSRGIHHVAYAYGPHYCLGATLANLEAEVAFSALFARYPDLALAVPPERLKWRLMQGARQLVRLPVRLGP